MVAKVVVGVLLLKVKPKQEAKAKEAAQKQKELPRESLGSQVKSQESCKLIEGQRSQSRRARARARAEEPESEPRVRTRSQEPQLQEPGDDMVSEPIISM